MSDPGTEKVNRRFTVLRGEDMNMSHLDRVMALDKKVYGKIDPEFEGTIYQLRKRFERNKRTFVCLMDGNELAAYVNFFPVRKKLLDQILGPCGHPISEDDSEDSEDFDADGYFSEIRYVPEDPDAHETEEEIARKRDDLIIEHYRKYQKSELDDDDGPAADIIPDEEVNIRSVRDFYNVCRDDDIEPYEIHPEYYPEKEKNNLFIISIVIDERYRGKDTSVELTDAFIEYLQDINEETPINSISAVCVSEGGEKFLRGLNFYFHREVECEPIVYVPDDPDDDEEKEKKESKIKKALKNLKEGKKDTESDDAGSESDEEDDLYADLKAYYELLNRTDELGTTGIEKKYHERIYLCWGDYLDRLLNKRMYHKTHKDDIYLFVPLAENPENSRIDEFIKDYKDQKKKAQGKAGGKDNDDKDYNFYYRGVIPGDKGDTIGKKKTKLLLDELQNCLDYEYEGFIKDELERIYLGECLFRHTTDRYAEDEADEGDVAIGETVGEEKADLLLLAYRSANMYVLVINLPNCKYSSSMVGDQLSKMKLEYRKSIDEFGFFHYGNILEHLEKKYNLVSCGSGKAFYCMNQLPSNGRQGRDTEDAECNQELMNILTGETYFSVHQDFYIKKYKKLEKQLTKDLAIYDYYQAYMSPVSIVMILDGFEKIENGVKVVDEENKILDAATYVFIVELVLLQNASLTKLSLKVGKALEHEGDVPYDYINRLYRDYGRTLKLWDSDNFKYYGTQMEAEQIRKALGNDELKERYEKEQEFLENIVDVNSANDERINGWILGIVGTLLAVFQVEDYIKNTISNIYLGIANLSGKPQSVLSISREAMEEAMRDVGPEGVEELFRAAADSEALRSFNVIVWGGAILFLIVWFVNYRRKKYEQTHGLHAEKDSDNWEG